MEEDFGLGIALDVNASAAIQGLLASFYILALQEPGKAFNEIEQAEVRIIAVEPGALARRQLGESIPWHDSRFYLPLIEISGIGNPMYAVSLNHSFMSNSLAAGDEVYYSLTGNATHGFRMCLLEQFKMAVTEANNSIAVE